MIMHQDPDVGEFINQITDGEPIMCFAWVLIFLFGFLLPLCIAWDLGKDKGQTFLGFCLGFIFGWIGVVVLALMPYPPKGRQ